MKEEKALGDAKNLENGSQTVNSFLDKDLEAALDSFDNLFCRRCLVSNILVVLDIRLFLPSVVKPAPSFLLCWQVFDCRLHGCSQDLVYPVS